MSSRAAFTALPLFQAANQMQDILICLKSPDNALRNEAEKDYNQAVKHKGICLDALSILASCGGVDEEVRSTAAVRLRLGAKDLWDGADISLKRIVKERLLLSIRADAPESLRTNLCGTIAAMGAPLIAEEPSQWPELLPTLLELGRSSIAYERENFLYIFSQLSAVLDQKVFYSHLGSLKAAFQTCLSDYDPGFQMKALRATCALFNLFESYLCEHFIDLVPLMLRLVQQAVQNGNEKRLQRVIESIMDVFQSEPKLWRNNLAIVCQLMLSVASTKFRIDEASPREMGLLFLVSIAETLPSQCRKMGSFVRSVFPVCLEMMINLEEDSEWYDQEHEEDTSADTLFACGRDSLDRITFAIGGKAVFPIAEALIHSFLSNEGFWGHRHAALVTVSKTGEACHKQIEAKLGDVIELVLARFGDPHPRVRWAAINCIGKMCTGFGPRIQKEFHSRIFYHLIAVMDDADNPRIQSHAAAAVEKFCEKATPSVIGPYLDALLGKLKYLLLSPHIPTKEGAVTAISAVAEAAQGQFVKYYDSFMPFLKHILRSDAEQKYLRRCRGKVMECISTISSSVGPQKFGPDSAEIMKLLLHTAASAAGNPRDMQNCYIMLAYANFCQCLKQDFIQYLPRVMSGLLYIARKGPNEQVRELKEDDESPDDSVNRYEPFQIGSRTPSRSTYVLEDKAVACNTIACLIAVLREHFYEYVHPVTELMIPLLKFFHHDECRTAAAGCLPDLIVCVLESNKDPTGKQMLNLVQCIFTPLLDAIKGEPDVEVLVHMVDALSRVAGLVEPPAIPQKLLNYSSQTISIILLESEARNIERYQQARQEDWDEEGQKDAEAKESNDLELFSKISNATRALLRMHSSAGFVHAFKASQKLDEKYDDVSTMHLFWTRLKNGRPAYERQAALFVLADFIFFGGQESIRLLPTAFSAMKAFSIDIDPDIRQAALFGVGVCAQVGGISFSTAGGGAVLANLEKVIRDKNSRSQSFESATDNAVSALMKIIEFQPSCLGDKAVSYVKLVLEYLPAKAHESEARVMHLSLARFVQNYDTRIMGKNDSNLPKILLVLSSVLGTVLFDEEYNHVAVDAIKGLKIRYSPESLQRAMAHLDDEQKRKIQDFAFAA